VELNRFKAMAVVASGWPLRITQSEKLVPAQAQAVQAKPQLTNQVNSVFARLANIVSLSAFACKKTSAEAA
jgi:hypothetical protein